ncbi:protein MULTIPLE CHLOROPLAST DIVISION SITE 1 [Phalaenopsis equestris]|uniref:protein MULTIPLE CHLOROPLAST DIVISION SITE 1 n=1 Tax=Phalaenopsis equestris TaxID=78828 RepID=UPI0009E63221|nr:protein MULTIPLE CHLOROPLAST DIVISION SITE 1 [Phalaenopsis equestris]
MSSNFNALALLPALSLIFGNGGRGLKVGDASNLEVLRFGKCRLRRSFRKVCGFRVMAAGNAVDSTGGEQVEGGVRVGFAAKALESDRVVGSLRGTINDLPSFVALVKNAQSKYAVGFYMTLTVVLMVACQILSKRKIQTQHGSVAELVKRGQLRASRRGILKSDLKYEDPFNNPQVKIQKNNSKIEMCGKVYRLAPVTLTQEQQFIHLQRRSRAYQWKRPTIFLKEGDLVPQDVDPDTIRWIPANHPFATTTTEMDEIMAQNNVFQKDGVPFRVRAEHEALQKKLEALENAQNEVGINRNNINEWERSSGPSSKLCEKVQPSPSLEKQNGESSSTGNTK